jgi:sulfide:quinone oxidoreductase
MPKPRVIILGAGFGGLSAAYALRRLAPDADLLLVDESPTFMMGLRKLWLLDGRSSRREGTRDRQRLRERGLPFRQTKVSKIDPERRRVSLNGESVSYDYLILALGAQPRVDLVPGNTQGIFNLFSADGAEQIGARLQDFERGRIVIAIAGVPFKCPPAPYEAAFIIDDLMRRTGRRGQVEIEVTTPQPSSLPAAGQAACDAVETTLAARRIRFRSKAAVEQVERSSVALAGGTKVEGDMIVLVPPHRPPSVVKESGLTGGSEWVKVNPRTLATAHERIFAIGDLTEMQTGAALPFPKAGVFAERHGEVVAANIAAMIAGRDPQEAFSGEGYCFLEVGGGVASRVQGNFLAAPPTITVDEPSVEARAAKETFERERLQRWFG